MPVGRRLGFVVCVLAIVAYEAYALFIHEAGQTEHLPPASDLHLTREINATAPLSQTFVMHATGFQGIELFPRAGDQPAIGPVEVSVWTDWNPLDGQWEFLGTARADPATLDLASSWHASFPRNDLPAGVLYRVEVTMPNAPPGRGLRFEAGGPTYPEGAMDIGGRREWGDLKFRTFAQRTTVFRNFQQLRRGLPPILHADAIWIALLVAINWAMATLLYVLGFSTQEPGPKGSATITDDQPRE